MKFRSTRKTAKSCQISEAIQQGLATDGGLFVPQDWPHMSIQPEWPRLSFAKLSIEVLRPFFTGDQLEKKLDEICTRAFDFPVPVQDLGNDTAVLELFYGPTNAFKDFGARFLALCLNELPRTLNRMVLVATSGDTGGAGAAAFSEFTDIPVVILYPKGKISPRQEKQLTVWGNRVRAFAVNGDFDDCQKLVKEAFNSPDWRKRFDLVSANSINLGRLLPQMVGFVFASLKYQADHGAEPGVIVPTGNAGHAVSALWARKIGFPIRKVIFAHNANQAVYGYFRSGQWRARKTIATLANAMDVSEPSNFERVLDLYPSLEELKKVADAYSITDDQICATVKTEWTLHRQLWCPHSAIAACVRQQLTDPHWIIAATAHPAKFETVLEPLIGSKIEIPINLKNLLSLKSKSELVNANLKSLQAALF